MKPFTRLDARAVPLDEAARCHRDLVFPARGKVAGVHPEVRLEFSLGDGAAGKGFVGPLSPGEAARLAQRPIVHRGGHSPSHH